MELSAGSVLYIIPSIRSGLVAEPAVEVTPLGPSFAVNFPNRLYAHECATMHPLFPHGSGIAKQIL